MDIEERPNDWLAYSIAPRYLYYARCSTMWGSDPEFASEFGVLCLARSSPYFDPADY